MFGFATDSERHFLLPCLGEEQMSVTGISGSTTILIAGAAASEGLLNTRRIQQDL